MAPPATEKAEAEPAVAVEAEEDPEDSHIFWDMVLVVPTDAKTVGKTKSKSKKKELYDQTYLAKRLAGAGLEYRCYASIQGDEVYVRVGASMKRLREQADVMDFKVRLDPARTKLAAKKGFPQFGINPIEIPNKTPDGVVISRYQPFEHIYGKYEPDPAIIDLYARDVEDRSFDSTQRLKLLHAAITNAKQFGGADLALDKRIKQGKMLAALAMHDPVERNLLYDNFVCAPLCTKPTALPIDQFKDYFGEKQGLACAFNAHLTNAYGILAVFGLAATIDQFAAGNAAAYRQGVKWNSIAAFAIVCVLWGVCVTEFWKRNEKRLAMRWGTVGFEAEEQIRPQFKGVDMKSPATGKSSVYFPPKQRQIRVMTGGAISFLCVCVDLVFIFGCIRLKQSSNSTTSFGGTLLQSIGIPVFAFLYTMVAVKLTDAENWQTNTVYQDKLVQKLTIFNFINSYFALFYDIFIPPDGWGIFKGTCDPQDYTDQLGGQIDYRKDACFANLRFNLMFIFAISVFTNNFLQSILGYLKYRANYFAESRGSGSLTEAFFSVPELQYLLAEFDETLDNIVAYQAQATQYGYITLFSAAFPACALLSFLNDSLLLRFDCNKLLKFYRRIQPDAAEDIGMYQTIFEGLNIAGAISSTAIIVYQTPIFRLKSDHSKDVLFICAVTAFFVIVTFFQLVIEDVHHDITLQIRRSEFVTSKIIDRIADEDDTLEFEEKTRIKAPVLEKDDLQPYFTTVAEFFDEDDGRTFPEVPDPEANRV